MNSREPLEIGGGVTRCGAIAKGGRDQYFPGDPPEWQVAVISDNETDLAFHYQRYRAWLVDIAQHYVHDRDLAEDSVQTVFMKLLRNGESPRAIHHYLVRAVRNECNRSQCRDRKRREREIRARTDGVASLDMAEGQETTTNRSIEEVLTLLPRRCADVVRLRTEGLSYETIGETLGVSVNTVDAQIQRAKKIAGTHFQRQSQSTSTA
ncbi:MAG: sigma-70 family RNA polymerase sigma factor [Gemmatimonadota bacterium]